MTLQTVLPPEFLRGEITIEVLDSADPDTTPYVIRKTDDFDVRVHWYLDGSFANVIGPPDAVWHLAVVAHALAGDMAKERTLLLNESIPLTQEVPPKPQLPRDYCALRKMAAGTLELGLYQLSASVSFDDGTGNAHGIAGFAETPVIQIMPGE